MTREEAIERLNIHKSTNVFVDSIAEAIDMAIEALSADTSSDLISRADAILWVKTECNQYGKPTLDYDSGLKVIEHLKKMPSELPSAEAEWIPVSERLPKAEDMYQPPEQRYLCQLEAYGEKKFCVLSRLKGAVSPFWDWYGVAVHDSEVIAWMPLPKPYREDGE